MPSGQLRKQLCCELKDQTINCQFDVQIAQSYRSLCHEPIQHILIYRKEATPSSGHLQKQALIHHHNPGIKTTNNNSFN
jgi:hypothetical protein